MPFILSILCILVKSVGLFLLAFWIGHGETGCERGRSRISAAGAATELQRSIF
jgi:hypothetical protein